jgi:hypothetical protein
MKSKFIHQRAGAYMTIEASFIVPAVLCIFLIVIYCCFYQYDRSCFDMDAYILCLRESHRKDASLWRAPQASKVKEASGEMFGNKYFLISNLDIRAKTKGREISCCGSADVRPEGFRGFYLMPEDIWTLRYAGHATQTDPALRLRRFRRLLYLKDMADKKLQDSRG